MKRSEIRERRLSFAIVPGLRFAPSGLRVFARLRCACAASASLVAARAADDSHHVTACAPSIAKEHGSSLPAFTASQSSAVDKLWRVREK
jgi:hypothetical protein